MKKRNDLNAIIDIDTKTDSYSITLLQEPKWSMFADFAKYGKRLLFFDSTEIPDKRILYSFEPEVLTISKEITEHLKIRYKTVTLKTFFIQWFCINGGVLKRDFRSFQNVTFELKELYDQGKLKIELRVDGKRAEPIIKKMKERIGTIQQKITQTKRENMCKRSGCPININQDKGDFILRKAMRKALKPGFIVPCCVCSNGERELLSWE